MHALRGKTALVTGGAKRLGRATASALAAAGVHVAIHYNTSESEAVGMVDELRRAGVTACAVGGNLANEAEALGVFESAINLLGNIDFLLNSASTFPEDRLGDVSLDSLSANIAVNAYAPLVLGRAFARQGREGAIVNFLDTRFLDYDAQHVSYHVSKRMLFSFTRMMALEFAPRVRVNAVAPGLVLPPVGKDEEYLKTLASSNPLQRHGVAEDVAEAVLFLLRSDFMTGQVIHIDGGRHMRGAVYG